MFSNYISKCTGSFLKYLQGSFMHLMHFNCIFLLQDVFVCADGIVGKILSHSLVSQVINFYNTVMGSE